MQPGEPVEVRGVLERDALEHRPHQVAAGVAAGQADRGASHLRAGSGARGRRGRARRSAGPTGGTAAASAPGARARPRRHRVAAGVALGELVAEHVAREPASREPAERYDSETHWPATAPRIMISVRSATSGRNSATLADRTAAVPAMSSSCPGADHPRAQSPAAVSPSPGRDRSPLRQAALPRRLRRQLSHLAAAADDPRQRAGCRPPPRAPRTRSRPARPRAREVEVAGVDERLVTARPARRPAT